MRAAAARGLGRWPGPETANALVPLFKDDKLAVRLSAAASYLRVTSDHPETESAPVQRPLQPTPAPEIEPTLNEHPQPALPPPADPHESADRL